MVIWITGLSGSGKTTIGKRVYENIKREYDNTVFLDGDIIRKALGNSFGHTLEDRLRLAKQISGLCSMLDNENINVVCSTISLFKEVQIENRRVFNGYVEVFLNVTMSELRIRDQKKLYSGNIKNVVGVDLSYYKPSNPELELDNSSLDMLETNISKITSFAMNLISKSENTNESLYWENYYKNHRMPSSPSPFAEFIAEYLEKDKKLIELGCGNGRDSIFFSTLGINVIGIDQCQDEINFLNKNYQDRFLYFEAKDFTNINKKYNYDYIYSRFTLHSIDENAEDRTLQWIYDSLYKDGMFFLEVRSIKDELFGEGKRIGKNEYFTDHYRRFVELEVIQSKLIDLGFNINYIKESKGFAPYKEEDPFVIRVIAQK